MGDKLGAPNSFQFTAATGTAAAISAASKRAASGFLIKAAIANTGIVYLGPSAATTTGNGYALEPGQSVSIPCDEAMRIFAIGSAASQVCTVLYT